MKFYILDAEDSLVGDEDGYESEPEAYKDKQIFNEHCTDIVRPLRVVSRFPLKAPELRSLSENERNRA